MLKNVSTPASIPTPSEAPTEPNPQAETAGAAPVCGSENHQCLTAELTKEDDRLNGAYRAVMGRLSTGDAAALRDAQRSWIKDRDRNCGEARVPEGRQIACKTEFTARRADELEALQ